MTLIRGETGAQRTLGYVLDVSRDDGRARCMLDVGEAHSNRHGVLHGGIAGVLLDNAMGATASLTVDKTGRSPFLTVSLSTNFVAAGIVGQRLTATGRVVGGGRSLLFIDGELRSEDGALIATAHGVFKRVPREKLAEGGDA
ncbi:Thioesterase superfamily protein [Roseivivax sp. THAF40]|uniref:PaaI family thioesterase n=1 Tax=unclassified Roseivivax TaxID=2639302 RepID=UPI0012679723|nr:MULTISPECIES: PaaI family thioesterase [unclassified Roseivivax]QFS81747.1 Thioesterase superfamily protein [Roseivivax sp. THAF197b]QFT45547.1 Thioesterase superfamily protein [Roseivivax sp. THAF40]